ncbi:sulfatase [Ruminococcaceae bacterium OttesenSCG-928-L11]|nr:sulfatase [Ruminococcaceae bacterium OttesenSCG-928-L11]
MKAIMVMYDSLRRDLLEPYGCDWTLTPNFKRLAEKSVCFQNNYVGSLPCMPARRELHTGRYNFLHRSWGPMEPFDDSMPEILKTNGIYSHLVSDHKHYWADGGSTYHTRYTTWECVRGQQGDPWKARLEWPTPPEVAFESPKGRDLFGVVRKQDDINRAYSATEETMPQAMTFELGLDFIENNHGSDNWFLQIETFDPHEPFYTQQEYKDLYPHDYDGKQADWPSYYYVKEDESVVNHTRYEYAALLSMCDRYLGKVLDMMDKHNLWEDTMLIVNTDHGFMLGEHGWWSKSVMPVYNEIANTPLFIYDPGSRVQGQVRHSLTQPIDLPATLLDFFGLPIPADMQGKSLRQTIVDDTPVREYALFGYHNGHANITDGEILYMRAPANKENSPLYEYTLMPTHMRGFFSPDEIQSAEFHEPLSFTKGMPVLRTKARGDIVNAINTGTKLYNLKADPHQETELDDAETEAKMANLLIRAMKDSDAPAEVYQRLGLNPDGMTAQSILDSRDAVALDLTPPILPQRNWSKGASNMIRSLYRMAGKQWPIVEEKLPAHLEGKTVIEPADIAAFIAQHLNDSDMLLYATTLAARTR